MSEYTLLEHCAPTLAGIKTGNLVSCVYQTKEEVRHDLRRWNRQLQPKGLRIIPLKYMKERVLLYLYRPGYLAADLRMPASRELLSRCGYGSDSENGCILTLIRHLKENSEFPHEIGLFLGYPAEDVRGFIEQKGIGYKYSGLWKVYGDVERARRMFERYSRCTAFYCGASKRGRTIAELAVAKG